MQREWKPQRKEEILMIQEYTKVFPSKQKEFKKLINKYAKKLLEHEDKQKAIVEQPKIINKQLEEISDKDKVKEQKV